MPYGAGRGAAYFAAHSAEPGLEPNPQRFRSLPQTTPSATRASISPFEYPTSPRISAACWLKPGGA